MNRLQYRSWLLGVALLLLLASKPLWAVGPTMIMFYGDGLQNPITLRGQDFGSTEFLWWQVGMPYVQRTTWTPPAGLNGRPYLKVAIFWGLGPFEDRAALVRALGDPDLLKQMKPEDASQHGRLYFPTATEPAVMVVTHPNMQRLQGTRCQGETPPSDDAPCPVAVPAKLEDFVAGWTLDLDVAKWLGIPRS